MTASPWSSSELFDIKLLLSCLSFIKNSDLTPEQHNMLIHSVEPVEYSSGTDIFRYNCKTVPALYILMKGRVWIKREGDDPIMLMQGQPFGEQLLTLGEGTDNNSEVDAPFTATADLQPRDGLTAVQCGRLTLDAFRKVFAVDDVKKETGDVITIRNKRNKKDKHASSSSLGAGSDDERKPKARTKKTKSAIISPKLEKLEKANKSQTDLAASPRKAKKSDKSVPKSLTPKPKSDSIPSPSKERSARNRSSEIDPAQEQVSGLSEPVGDKSTPPKVSQSSSFGKEETPTKLNKRSPAKEKASASPTSSSAETGQAVNPTGRSPKRSSRTSSKLKKAAVVEEQDDGPQDNSIALDDLLDESDGDIEIEVDEVEKPQKPVRRAPREPSIILTKEDFPRHSSRTNDEAEAEQSLTLVDAMSSPPKTASLADTDDFARKPGSIEPQSSSLDDEEDDEGELSLQDIMKDHQLDRNKRSLSPSGRVRQDGMNVSKSKLAYLEAISSTPPVSARSSPVSTKSDKARIGPSSLAALPSLMTEHTKPQKDSELSMSKSKLAYLDAISQKSPMPSPKTSPIKELLDVSKTKLMYLDAVSRRPSALGSSSSLDLNVDLEASILHFENDETASEGAKAAPNQSLRRIRQGSLKVTPTYASNTGGANPNAAAGTQQSLRRPRAISLKETTRDSGRLDKFKPSATDAERMPVHREETSSASESSVRRLRQGSWTPTQSVPASSKPLNVRKLRQDSLKAFQGKATSSSPSAESKVKPTKHQNDSLLGRSEASLDNSSLLLTDTGGDDASSNGHSKLSSGPNDPVAEMQVEDVDDESNRITSIASKSLNVRKLRQDSLKAFQVKKSLVSSNAQPDQKERQRSMKGSEASVCNELVDEVTGARGAAKDGQKQRQYANNSQDRDEHQKSQSSDELLGQASSAIADNHAKSGVLSGELPLPAVSGVGFILESSMKKKKKQGAKVSFQAGFATFADETPKYDDDEGSVDSALHDEQSEEYKIETDATSPAIESAASLPDGPSQSPSTSDKQAKKKEKKDKKGKGSKSSKRKGRQSSTEFGIIPRERAKELALADPDSVPRRPPGNVFQKPLQVASDYKAPTYEKSDKSRKTISKALSTVYAFKHLEKKDKKKLVSAFEPQFYGSGTEFLKPGELDEFFYVVDDGTVAVEIDGKEAREYRDGDAFGASNLVHSIPNRSKSMRAKSAVNLFRVDQTTYRSILQLETLKLNSIKRKLLDSVKLFEKVSDKNKQKLADVMKPQVFVKGETIVKEHDYGNEFFIVEDGKIRCEDPELGKGSGRTIERGGYFGETGIVKGDSKPMNIIAKSDVAVYCVDRHVFETILGPTRHVIMSEVDARVLSGITCLQFSVTKRLKTEQINDLLSMIEDQNFGKGQTILDSGVEIPAALYFVRKGEANSQKGRMLSVLGPGSVFGTDLFESAKDQKCTVGQTSFKVVATERTICGVLRIEDWYTVKKKYFKVKADLHGSDSEIKHEEDLKRRNFEFANLVKNVLLGEGQFGQVWMVHDKTESPIQPYAMKIQSKFQLLEEGQAEACIREKEALAAMFHPNIIKLCATFQDNDFVYMLLQLLQGGELFNLIHPIDADISVNGLAEEKARFYAFCIADALAHVHSKCYLYRDTKPENILIDAKGYPVLIDFGFAKKMVEDKTFTLCGTPGYLPPECCLSLGHSYAADHWSFGILVYEMLCGESPFFFYGIDTSELYRSIVQDDFPPLPNASAEAVSLIDGLLVKDPNFRLGSIAGGESDIISHPWFQGLDVFEMRKKNLKAPWKPDIKDPFDASHFEDWSDLEDKTSQKFLPLSEAESAVFKNF